MLVFVQNKDGSPLMPCSPRKARILLKEKKAKVISIEPFVIQLLYGSSGYKQKVYAGRDRGLTQGVGDVREDGKILFIAEVQGRADISEKVYARACLRRNRRSRKTRYREPRFLNRKRTEGWLPPSVSHFWLEHEKIKQVIEKLLPITSWGEEYNKFDTRKMSDPKVKDYQKGPLSGKKNAREYILERDSYRCVLCDDPESLEAHHIVWRFRGGSDRPKNLTTLCKSCHDKVTTKRISIAKVYESYRWPARLNSLNPRFNSSGATLVSPSETKKARKELRIKKSHASDALAVIYCAFGVKPKREKVRVQRGRFVRTHNRQKNKANPVKGGEMPVYEANKFIINKSGVRFEKRDLVKHQKREVVGYVSSLKSAGTVVVADWKGKRLGGFSSSKLKKLQNGGCVDWK